MGNKLYSCLLRSNDCVCELLFTFLSHTKTVFFVGNQNLRHFGFLPLIYPKFSRFCFWFLCFKLLFF